MFLIYCAALNLLQAIETEEQRRRAHRWNREEGMKVANLLGEKTLIKTSTFEGRAAVKLNNAVIKKGNAAAVLRDLRHCHFYEDQYEQT